MKKIVFAGIIFLSTTLFVGKIAAQNPATTPVPAATTTPAPAPADEKPTIKVSGFVNSQLFYDTRQTLNSRETQMMYYPLGLKKGTDGSDLNAHPNFNQLAMTSRLRATISGPNILDAKTIAVIESDFTGASNAENNSFRLRHAFIKMNWKLDEIIIGQYWHPLDVPEMLPNVTSLNTGAPFHPFSRHIQLRWAHTFFEKLTLIGVVASQRDYASDGPDLTDATKTANSASFQRNAIIPNEHLQLQYKTGKVMFGAGVDYKVLRPRLFTSALYENTAKLYSYAGIAFVNVMLKTVDIKFQAIYGQNMSEHQMLGGYADKLIDPLTKETSYTNIDQASAWVNVWTKREHFNFGFFAGYAKNLGAKDDIVGLKYGRGFDIAYVYRVTPMASYTFKNFKVMAEIEYTAAAYGTPDVKDVVTKTTEYNNIRGLVGIFYNF